MTIRLNGSTSGYVEIDAAAVAGAGVLTLPTGTGTLLTAEGSKILQVVRATDSTNRATTSTSAVDASISVTITPTKNTSAILVIWSVSCFPPNSAYANLLITDSSNVALSGAQRQIIGLGIATQRMFGNLFGYSTPATTSAVTYKGRFYSSSGNTDLANADNTGQMYAIEVSA